MDARLRALERRWQATRELDDHAAWLRERVRAGQLPRLELELAALEGDAASALASRGLPCLLLVVQFWATWNRHDDAVTRTLDALRVPDVEWLLHRVDVDQDLDLATACNVMNVPLLVGFRAGVERGRLTGVRPAEALTTWLRGLWNDAAAPSS